MKDLRNIPFEELANDVASLNCDEKAIMKYNAAGNADNFFNRHNLKDKEGWLLPQLTAKLAAFRLTRNADNGLINGKKFWTENVDMSSKWDQGIYHLVQTLNRGSLVSKQNKPEGIRYSALVPLALAAHKDFNGIAYSDWDSVTLGHVVDPYLLAAMLSEPPKYTKDELLGFREAALVFKNDASKRRSITGMFRVPSVYNIEFDKLPGFTKLMLLQSWVANQINRTDLMVLDPYNWDTMPESLLDGGSITQLPFVVTPKHSITPSGVQRLT